MKNLLVLALLAYCSYSFAADSKSPGYESFIARMNAVASSDKPTRDKSDEISAQYVARFSADTAAIPKDELDEFFEATWTMLFYTTDRTRLFRLESIFARLVDAGKAAPKHYKDVLDAYFALREFDKANQLIERHGPMLSPSRPLLAEDLSSPQARRTAWFHQGQRLTRLDVDLDKGTHLVIIGSPYCHFASNALSQMENDPVLRPLLASRVNVIAMNDFNFNHDVYAAWNTAHPSLPFRLAHNREEWPEVTDWVSPVFLFFENGKLLSQFSGWPAEGRMHKIHQGFGLPVASGSPVPSR